MEVGVPGLVQRPANGIAVAAMVAQGVARNVHAPTAAVIALGKSIKDVDRGRVAHVNEALSFGEST